MLGINCAQAVGVLKAAKLLLSSPGEPKCPGKYMHLCSAIEVGGYDNPAAPLLINLINTRMDGCFVLERWIHNQGISGFDTTFDNMQEYRHRWLQELINEFLT